MDYGGGPVEAKEESLHAFPEQKERTLITYTFPQLIHDACVLAVQPVLSRALSGAIGDDMDDQEAEHYILSILKEEQDAKDVQLLPGEEGPDLSGLGFRALFYLVFRQPYTGLERDPSIRGALSHLTEHYDMTEEQIDMLWMTQHIYQTACEQLLSADPASPEVDFSTWTDERALDIIKVAISPFGEDVDAFIAPLMTALEVQTDMKRADNGDPNAMMEVAYDLIEGRGVATDFKQAERWAREALAQQTSRAEEAQKMVAFLELLNERE